MLDTTISYTKDQEANDLIIGTTALYKEIKLPVNKNKPTNSVDTLHQLLLCYKDEKKYIFLVILQKNEIRLWLAGHEHDHVAQPITLFTPIAGW
ncbi:hypothetical protein [Phocaeicola sartorii]|uniref:hypothetical protein n=1 Tax=Phocaeicola sartorii TaxID=671267 RepID=UPI003F693CC6